MMHPLIHTASTHQLADCRVLLISATQENNIYTHGYTFYLNYVHLRTVGYWPLVI